MAKKEDSKKQTLAEESVVPEIVTHNEADVAVEKRLTALYTLQSVDSQIDKIKIIRGELPQAIQDLEDEIAGLLTRIEKFATSIKEHETAITQRKNEIVDHEAEIKRHQIQLDNVRNNREYEAINKEIEFQDLEIQLCERKNRDASAKIKEIQERIEAANLLLTNRQNELTAKKSELEGIMQETEKDETRLTQLSKEQEQYIEERYLTAYKRIRKAARNGLAVVTIDRDACGGCFSKIPPQRQTEIKMHKKVIVCEYCGRIIVDDDIARRVQEQLDTLK